MLPFIAISVGLCNILFISLIQIVFFLSTKLEHKLGLVLMWGLRRRAMPGLTKLRFARQNLLRAIQYLFTACPSDNYYFMKNPSQNIFFSKILYPPPLLEIEWWPPKAQGPNQLCNDRYRIGNRAPLPDVVYVKSTRETRIS